MSHDGAMQHSARSREYRIIIEHMVRYAFLLEADELAELAAILATAESQILAKMADRYPEECLSKY